MLAKLRILPERLSFTTKPARFYSCFGTLFRSLLCGLLVTLSASERVVFSSTTAPSNESMNHACQKIVKVCQSAGYTMHGHKSGKGLWQDCYNPLLADKTVAGVSIDASIVKSCKENLAGSK